MTQNQISAIIRNRRSVYPKNYTTEKVQRGVIEEMLENANWAPTHKLTEPWHFTVFEGDGLRTFADFQSSKYKKKAEREGTFDEAKYQKLKTKPLACSHIIAVGMKRDPRESIPEIEEIAAVSCAVQNMLLTASELGVGCYWSTGGVTYYPEAKSYFGLGEKDKLMGFLMLGVPSSIPNTGKRRPVEEKVQWVSD